MSAPARRGWWRWGGGSALSVAALAIIAALTPLHAAAAGATQSVSVMLHVPIVKQDMPLDCEAAALASAMRYRGVGISQNQVFDDLPKDGRAAELRNGVLLHWGDPYTAFIGNVWGGEPNYTGYGVYYPPIAAVAVSHGLATDAHAGWTLDELVAELRAGNPVVVWVPWHLEAVRVTSYVAYDGRRVWFSIGEHAQVLAGYDAAAQTITLMDPLSGSYQSYPAALFMTRFTAWEAEAVAVKPPPCPTLGPIPGDPLPTSAAAWTGCSPAPRPEGPGGVSGVARGALTGGPALPLQSPTATMAGRGSGPPRATRAASPARESPPPPGVVTPGPAVTGGDGTAGAPAGLGRSGPPLTTPHARAEGAPDHAPEAPTPAPLSAPRGAGGPGLLGAGARASPPAPLRP